MKRCLPLSWLAVCIDPSIYLYQTQYGKYIQHHPIFFHHYIQIEIKIQMMNSPSKQDKKNHPQKIDRFRNRSQSTTHHLSRRQPTIRSQNQLTFYLGKGNNEGAVRMVMEGRTNWVQSQDSTSAFISMKWQQDQKGFKYNRLIESGQYKGIVNHFQFHQHLSNKELLFRSLSRYCNKTGVDLWKIVPPTFILNSKDQCCMQFLQLFTDFYQKHYPKKLKKQTDVQKEIMNQRRKLKMYFYLCNLKKIPPKNPPLNQVFINREEGQYLWIVKPTFLNRGRGIQIFSTLTQLSKIVSENVEGYVQRKIGQLKSESKPKIFVNYIKKNSQLKRLPTLQKQHLTWKDRRQDIQNQSSFDGNQFIRMIPDGPALIKTDAFLIQKYLERPLLIFNRKFDIRMWVLMTHQMNAYVFPEGYIRLSSQEYICKKSKDSFIHLTNNSVQRFSEDYGKIAEGNQLSFKELKEIMEANQLNYERSKAQMYNHIRVSLNATMKKLNQYKRKFVFQIFGYDFMIDETGHPWLIEVNTNPSIEESSKLLKVLIPRMLDDAFKLTIDSLFFGSYSNGNYPVQGYGRENMWVHLKLDEKC